MPLTDAQRSHLEQRLLEERAQTTKALEQYARDTSETAREEAGDLSLVPLHPADEGTDTIDRELEASNASRESRQLAEIDAALERLSKTPERYGRCENTGVDIPFERLDLIPWARVCAER